MWFLTGRPTKINCEFVVESKEKGYQSTTFKLKANFANEQENSIVAIPFPWTGYKPNGSLVIVNNNIDYCVYKNIRVFRKAVSELDFISVQEMLTHYVSENTGVIVFTLKHNTEAEFKYLHKISVFSKLIIATKLPQTLIITKPEIKMTVKVVNGESFGLQPFVKKIENNEYEITEFEEDTKFSTTSWDSSDDE